MDADLNTIAGRDAELKAVSDRYTQKFMDMWRTDKYIAKDQPMPDTFAGVTNFLYIMDTLFQRFPGFRYGTTGLTIFSPCVCACSLSYDQSI